LILKWNRPECISPAILIILHFGVQVDRESLEVASKPHLRPNGGVVPRSGIRANSIGLRCITGLFKVAHPPECVADCAFSIGLRLALEPDLRF